MSRLTRRPNSAPRRVVSPRVRLLLRPLEERVVPTVYTVTNTNDSGTGSLRAAITAADADPAAPHTIDLGGITGTITLASPLPGLTNDMTISGPGAGSLTITGYAAGVRVFYQVTPNLTVNGLTLTGRVSGAGAAITQAATGNENLTVTNTVITGCSAGGAGGAIYNYFGGTVTITGSTIQNCTETWAAIAMAASVTTPQPTLNVTNSQLLNNRSTENGGAIGFYYPGALSIDHSTIAGNSANNGGGVNFASTGSGVTINASTIANNTASGVGSTGGGISASGTAPVNVTSTTITGNVATTGGGIAVIQTAAHTVTLDNSIVSGNTATTGPDIKSVYTVQAAYSVLGTSAGYTLTDNGGNLTGSNASPAALELHPLAPVSGPNGTFQMAAIGFGSTALAAGDPAVVGTTDERGFPRPQSGVPDIGAFERVPGPDAAATTHAVTQPSPAEPVTYTFTVTYADSAPINTATIDSNDVSVTGTLSSGGTVAPAVSFVSYNASNPTNVVATYSFTAPGGTWVLTDNGAYVVTMNASQVSDANGFVSAGQIGSFQVLVPQTFVVTNVSDGGAGSLRAAITAANADTSGASDVIDMTGITGTISLLTALPAITNPATITGPGGANLTVSRGSGSLRIFATGPALSLGTNTVTMSGFTVAGGNSGPGAGIDVTGGNLALSDMVLQGNSSSTHGGAIYSASTGSITIANSTLQNNTAAGRGAAVYNGPGALTIMGSQLLNNLSTGDGAAINSTSSHLTLSGDTIAGNSAGGAGSICSSATSGAFLITNTTVQNNTASGAAIYNGSLASLTISNSQILNNRSTSASGGVCSAGNVTLTGDTIAGNSSSSSGGGVFTGQGPLTIANCQIVNNIAAGVGGGIATGPNPIGITITGSTVSGNLAKSLTGGGGGIYFSGTIGPGGVSITNTTIANNTAVNGGGLEIKLLNGTATLTSDTITGNTATNTNVIPGLGGGGIGLQSVTTVAGAVANINLDNTIVSGNAAANGFADIAAVKASTPLMTTAILAHYSAVGITAGVTLTNGGNNLIGGSLLLGALGSYGGTGQTVALLAGSPLVDAGDPALGGGGATDERGTPRPQGTGVDIGAYERTPNTLSAGATVSDVLTLAGAANPTYQFTVTYADDVAIDTTSLDSNDVTITPPPGVAAPAVSLVSINSGNPNRVVATYQFTAPTGAWVLTDAGGYAVNMVAGQVTDTNGSVPAGPLATFVVAPPQVFTVTNPADSGTGTLRAAIAAANGIAAANLLTPVPSVIVFNTNPANGTDFSQPRTIGLVSALPTVTDNLTITGPGSGLLTIAHLGGTLGFLPISDPTGSIAVSLSGLTMNGALSSGAGGAIDDNSGAALTLTDVTIKNSSASYYGGGIYLSVAGTAVALTNCTLQANTAGPGFSGGAIGFGGSGALTLSNSSIVSNRAAGGGGGVSVVTGANTYVTITQSTIANNSASGIGGGINLPAGANVMIDRSTLSGNTSGGAGGALYFADPGGAAGLVVVNSTVANNRGTTGGGIAFAGGPGTATVVGTTVTGNSATADGGGVGNPSTTAATITLDNSIVTGNSAAGAASDIGANLTGTYAYSAVGVPNGLTDGGNNVSSANSTPTALHLGALATNGGPTKTIAFSVGSPLVNAGDPTMNLTTDQRGQPRSVGGAPDIGAYEYVPMAVAGVQVNDGSAQRSEVRSIAVTFSGPVSFAGGNANAAAAFQLQHVQTGDNVNLAAAVSTNAAGQTVVTLTFLPTTVNGVSDTDPLSAANGGQLSLADGRYQLTVSGAAVSDAALGWALDGDANGVPGGNFVTPAETSYLPTALRLYRLFGDATGDGVVDLSDLTAFRSTYNAGTGNLAYLAYLDADNSGAIDLTDLAEFRNRYNHSVFV
jgi:predicted outer membrane repeat protein